MATGLGTLVCVSAAVGCSYAPHPQVLDGLGYDRLPATPLRLYVAPEIDLEGGYQEKLTDHGFPSLRELVVAQLGGAAYKIELRQSETQDTARRGFITTIQNPFTVVDDSTLADAVIRIAIKKFGHGDKWSSNDKLLFLALAGSGIAPARHDQVGALLCEARVERTGDGSSVYEFDFVGVSTETRDDVAGMREALDRARLSFINGLLQPRQ